MDVLRRAGVPGFNCRLPLSRATRSAARMDGQGDSQEVRASAFTSPDVSRSFSFHFILFLDASLFFQFFLHFPQAKCRTFFSSAAWQYAFQLGT